VITASLRSPGHGTEQPACRGARGTPCGTVSYTSGVAVGMKRLTAFAVALTFVTGIGIAAAGPDDVVAASVVLRDLGFSLTEVTPEKMPTASARRGVLVPTPWGEVLATIVSTPVDRMLRVPLAPNVDARQEWVLQPYVTAGTRKDVDADPVLEQAKPSTFADSGRTNLKAGAGVSLRLDENIELFGEFQFMRLNRSTEGRISVGPFGASVDSNGFSLGLSVRY
jgi:hypothetical protein